MKIIGDNIISSLGFTTEENYLAIKQGSSGIKRYNAGTFDLPEPFMASLIDKEKLDDEFLKISSEKKITNLEKAAILSVFLANKKTDVDLSSEKTIFILSTTKGNIDQLVMNNKQLTINNGGEGQNYYSLYLWHTAELIARFYKNHNTPIVVSNACISGAAAQIVAMRELRSGKYEHAVVVGVDFISKFIISGFQAFKALSPERCRPFEKERCGLNLGEAAATMIFSRIDTGYAPTLQCGAIRNDASHISAPSRTGEGSFRALKSILQNINIEDIAFINAHGTATPYNDDMEMCAIARAGLEKVPVNSLKSCFGHTLGAAGVVESIISTHLLSEKKSVKKYFIKMMSGFGGVNAALLFCNPLM